MMVAVGCDCARAKAYTSSGQYVSTTSFRRCCYEKDGAGAVEESFCLSSASNDTFHFFFCFSHAFFTSESAPPPNPLPRQQPRDARTRGEKRCRCAHDGVDEGDGQVTHLPQWRGEPTAASAAAAGRPSSLRAVRARSVLQRCSPEMERPPLKPARPQCYTPPPHGPNLPSVSTWHDDVGSLLRSTLLRPPPPEKKEVKGG